MKLRLYWDEDALKEIAKDCDNKQLKKDVAYGRFLFHHQKQKLFCEWTDDSFCIGSLNKNSFLIVGLGTRTKARNNLYGELRILERGQRAKRSMKMVAHTVNA